ncbi:MAG: hypothetical protein ABH835_01615 [Patescibacteria group bacterium]
MPNIIDVVVKEVLEDELVLELPSGQTMSWPQHISEHRHLPGDGIKLTINSEKDIVNQILSG